MTTDTDTQVFLYGTLLHAPLLEVVAGESVHGTRAVLRDHFLSTAKGQVFPLVSEKVGGQVSGLLVSVSAEAMRRMDFYELGFGYAPHDLEIEVESQSRKALVYLPEPGLWSIGEPWCLEDWAADNGDLTVETAKEYMKLEGEVNPREAGRMYPQFQVRAASRIRARNSRRSTDLGPVPAVADLTLQESQLPYANFFAVREDDLSFPQFGGGQSPVVRRAAFLGGDAVTVLPYDPDLDAVLVVRQFRHGAFARGDPQPWCVEPIAGRIDPGETPEVAARREALEEAGLELTELQSVAQYYPSPGVLSEFLYSFVARADLSGRGPVVHGVATEAEDIESRVVGLDKFRDLIASGEADTGPLILSVLWLQANRDLFRRQD